MSKEKVELIVLVEKEGQKATFHIPAERTDDLEGWSLVGFYSAKNKFHPSVAYVSCDDEFKEVGCLPTALNELNDFVYYWNAARENKRETFVSLVNEGGYSFEDALKRVTTCKSYITSVGKPATTEEQDKILGQFYAEAVVDYKLRDVKTCFSKSTSLNWYFDYETYGRDIRWNGENGYWSEKYNRWVVNPIGTCDLEE